MPYKNRRRRLSSGTHDLDALRKQFFREWWCLRCGHWDSGFRTINSRAAMLEWYSANCESFDTMRTVTDGLALGHRPGARHPGWWFTVGFPEHGPRLVVDSERVEQQIERINAGVFKRRDSFSRSSDPAEILSFTVPLRDFPDGFEKSQEYLDRHGVLDFEEAETI